MNRFSIWQTYYFEHRHHAGKSESISFMNYSQIEWAILLTFENIVLKIVENTLNENKKKFWTHWKNMLTRHCFFANNT